MEDSRKETSHLLLNRGGTPMNSASFEAAFREIAVNSSNEDNLVKSENSLAVSFASDSASSAILPKPTATYFYDNSVQHNINSLNLQASKPSVFSTSAAPEHHKNSNFLYFTSSVDNVAHSVFPPDRNVSSSCVNMNSISVQSSTNAGMHFASNDDIIPPPTLLSNSFSPPNVSNQMQNQEYNYSGYFCNIPDNINNVRHYGSPLPGSFIPLESAVAVDATRPNVLNEYNNNNNNPYNINALSSPNAPQHRNYVPQAPTSSVMPFYAASAANACCHVPATTYTDSQQSLMLNKNAGVYNADNNSSLDSQSMFSSSSARSTSLYQAINDYARKRENYDQPHPQCLASHQPANTIQLSTGIISNRLAEFRNNLQSLSLNKDVLMPRPDGSFYPYWLSLAINYQGIAESIVQSIYNCEYPPGIVSVMAEQLAYLRIKLQEFPEMAENDKDKFRRLYVLAALGMIAKLKLITFCWTYVELKESEPMNEKLNKIEKINEMTSNEMMVRVGNLEREERFDAIHQSDKADS